MATDLTNLQSAFKPILLASRCIGLFPYTIDKKSYKLILTKSSIVIQIWQGIIFVLCTLSMFILSFHDTGGPLTTVDKSTKIVTGCISSFHVVVMMLFFYIKRKQISNLLTQIINLEKKLNGIYVYINFNKLYKNNI